MQGWTRLENVASCSCRQSAEADQVQRAIGHDEDPCCSLEMHAQRIQTRFLRAEPD